MRDTKEHILKVALTLFLQKNYKEVTMSELVEKTGLSKGAFYHYFESKEQLFKEVVKHAVDFARVRFSEVDHSSLFNFYNDVTQKVNNATLELIYMGDDSQTFNFFGILFDAIKMFPNLIEDFATAQEVESNEWVSVIASARKSGEIKTVMSDKQIADIFISIGDGIALNSIIAQNSKTSISRIIDLWDSFYHSIKA